MALLRARRLSNEENSKDRDRFSAVLDRRLACLYPLRWLLASARYVSDSLGKTYRRTARGTVSGEPHVGSPSPRIDPLPSNLGGAYRLFPHIIFVAVILFKFIVTKS